MTTTTDITDAGLRARSTNYKVYAMTTLYAPDAGRYYQGAAVVMAVAQLLTWSGFRQQDRALRKG